FTTVSILNNVPMLRVVSIPQLPSRASVCFNAAGDLLQCGGSSLRWKTKVQPFLGGLDIVRRLRPISFNWKEGGQRDIGLGAEDVAKVAPSFTFTDSNGEITGVRYERLDILLINAVKEQQQQLEHQRHEIAQLQGQVRQLRAAAHRRRVRVRV
ncbi:MAG: tail fiber domain-containing protein, partial [Pyrinomonadaceae bacterium]